MIEVLVAASLVGGGLTIDPATTPPGDFYVAGDLGLQEGRLEVDDEWYGGSYDLSPDWSAHLRTGYRINEAWRVEVEAAQRVSDIGEVCFARLSCLSSVDYLGRDLGDFERTSLHLNVLYDLPFSHHALRPFVGAGIGATRVSMEWGSLYGSGDDLAWSGQLIAGAAVAVTPRLSLDVTYRYVRLVDVKTYGNPAGAAAQCGLPPPPCPPPPPPPDGINVGRGPSGPTFGDDHILSVGLRYAFGRAD